MKFLFPFLLSTMLATSASAAVLTFSELQPPTVNPYADEVFGDVRENVAADIFGTRIGPRGSDVSPYTSIGSNAYAVYKFDPSRELSFAWGTPDLYNLVEFFLDGNLVDTVAGFGNGSSVSDPFVTITSIGLTGLFDSVRFSSTSVAFEYDSLSVAAVPLPAAGLFLFGALGSLVFFRRRKTA